MKTKTLQRAGMLVAGATLATGLLPFQAMAAAPAVGFGGPQCDVANSWFSWSQQALPLQAGNDAMQLCALTLTDPTAKGLTGVQPKLTLSADSIASSGHTVTELARMLAVDTYLLQPGVATAKREARTWTVNADGSLTLDVPAFDLPPVVIDGNTYGGGEFRFELSAGPAVSSFLLQGDVQVVDSTGGDSRKAPVSINYLGNGHSITFGAPSTFVPIAPVRLMDTRQGLGVAQAPVGQGGTVTLPVTGVHGVPASGVTAVVLNVTATDPTADSHVIVYPHGQGRPTTSNLNFTARQTVPNLVTVPVVDGKINFYNNAGSVDLIADISGYYTSDGTGSRFADMAPVRLMDTRQGLGVAQAPVGQGGTVTLPVTGVHGVPASGVTAVVLNVTVTDPTADSHVIVYPHGQGRPTTSNLNFTARQTVPNLVTVPVVDGKINFYNNAGSVELIADISGYYTSDGTGSVFIPTSPTRVLDTRENNGHLGPVGPGRAIAIRPDLWEYGMPPVGVKAFVLNVTATDTTADSYVSVFGSMGSWPTSSNLNFTAGQTVPNAVVTSNAGGVTLYNHVGQVNLVADAFGYFTAG